MTEQTNHNTQSRNAGSTQFLNVKEVIAAILHYLVPGFEEMSIKDIVKECIDPVNSDESFVDTFISEGYMPELLKLEDYLICIIKLPESLRKKEESDRLLLHLQIMNQKPDYPLGRQISAIRRFLFLEQAEFLGIHTEEEFYRDAIPVLSIWFLFNQNEGKTFILNKPGVYRPPEKTGDKEAHQNTEDKSLPENFDPNSLPENLKDDPLPEIIIVNVDKDLPSDEPIYRIVKDLIEGSEEEVKQTLDLLGAKIENID